jgi:hypothetical protein
MPRRPDPDVSVAIRELGPDRESARRHLFAAVHPICHRLLGGSGAGVVRARERARAPRADALLDRPDPRW